VNIALPKIGRAVLDELYQGFNDGTWDAEKLQSGQLNQAATRQLCCLGRIAQQSPKNYRSQAVTQLVNALDLL
jgi:hypothetical protein